ncbi:hypothetical protein TanjilG_14220 [Lupinus angustifolius]|uniref:FHA domain-containing protein n=1 Tax=Lupinus angustifolius TaxID=3871 RepID=A0A1J7HH22_LUPAN|nr:PREDICTED: transcriptional activator FHA1-like [Lupinus angustifolius]OIW01037.1 hypothetical protein TanjilG_14220 [Lupinus angustifolius]
MGSSVGADGRVEAGFAKLQGKDFVFYMQTYSILLGRSSKISPVDVDLSRLGGGTTISRHHARIYYDFTCHHFALEVLGKKGVFVKGVLHSLGDPPVKLASQDLLQIGNKEFYFLLPSKGINKRSSQFSIPLSTVPLPGGAAVGAKNGDDNVDVKVNDDGEIGKGS